MRVLLFHEFSGVHTELKKGLKKLGVHADIATFGDYHKQYQSDLWIGPVSPGIVGSFGRIWAQLSQAFNLRSYDIIQSISPLPFNQAVSWLLEKAILGLAGPRYVYVFAGSDAVYRKHVRELDYWPPHDWYENPRIERIEKRITGRACRTVSVVWDYHFTAGRAGFRPIYIPLPVAIEDVPPVNVGAKTRIVVYHPLNRAEGDDFKGTSHIRAAFAALRSSLSNTADFIEGGGMSFQEYMEATASADIIVDQTNSYGYGMSALYALARGQVVLSGNEIRTHGLGSYAQSPVINIQPNKSQITDVIAGLISNRDQLSMLGRKGRTYARRYHCSEKVAMMYHSLYLEILKPAR